jgi:manganese/iron transport system permease protein
MNSPMSKGALLEPFRPLFMQRALIEVLVLAIPAGLLGTWVVSRRLAFATHALGHVTFPVVVIAILAGWSVFGATLAATVAVALVLAWASRRTELASGVAVAITLAAALAIGAVLVSDIAAPGVRANSILFGSLLAVGSAEIVRTVAVAAVVVGVTVVAGRELAAATFHRELAVAEGRRPTLSELALMIALGAAVAVAVESVGSLLVSALFLVPSATARLIVDRVIPLHLLGIGLAMVDGVAGLWIAYQLDAPPGASIAVVATALFALVAGAKAMVIRAQRMAAVPS